MNKNKEMKIEVFCKNCKWKGNKQHCEHPTLKTSWKSHVTGKTYYQYSCSSVSYLKNVSFDCVLYEPKFMKRLWDKIVDVLMCVIMC